MIILARDSEGNLVEIDVSPINYNGIPQSWLGHLRTCYGCPGCYPGHPVDRQYRQDYWWTR